MIRLVCAFGLMLSVTFSSGAFARDELAFALDKYVKRSVKQGIPGAALAVIEDGSVRLLRGYGVTKKGGTKIDSATVFPLASISKTFASAASAILIREGNYNWETPIASQLEKLTFSDEARGEQLTVRHILSQSTGLVPQAYSDLLEDGVSYSRILQMLNRVRFVCEPGSCYSYQNIVYNLSADLVDKITGTTYQEFIEKRVFGPLDMSHASFGLEAFKAEDNRVTPHVLVKKGFAAVKPAPYYYEVPAAAGVNASAQDLAKWMLAQFGKNTDVLDEQSLETLHTPHIRANQRRYRAKMSNVYYGLGWRTFDYQKITGFVHHGGWVRGIRTEMVFNPETQTGMVFLTNCETPVAREIVIKFLSLYKQHVASTSTD